VAVVVAAAITLRDHAAEALLEVDMPQWDTPAVAMLGLEWGRLELDGTVLTGPARGTVAAIGTAPTMAVIGTVAITGMAIIGVATTGTAIIGIIIIAMMWSSSVALAFRIGGGGGLRGAGTTAIHTAIILMAMVAPTGTVTAVTRMVMATGIIMDTAMEATDTAPSTSLATETAANPESPSCNSGCHGLAITVDPSTESWGRKRGAQSGRTSKTTITQVNRRHYAERSRACNNLSLDRPAVS
jgi:hypothetical protein